MPCISYTEEQEVMWKLDRILNRNSSNICNHNLPENNYPVNPRGIVNEKNIVYDTTSILRKKLRESQIRENQLESLLCEALQLINENNLNIQERTKLCEFYIEHKKKDEEKVFKPIPCAKCNIELVKNYSIINKKGHLSYLCENCV